MVKISAAHESEALAEGISREIIEIIKHRKETNGLDEADGIVIELGEQRSLGALRQFQAVPYMMSGTATLRT